MRLAMNADLKLDEAEARPEAQRCCGHRGVRLTCWVGAGERGEFIRQNALLANMWTGLGALTASSKRPTATTTTSSRGSPIPRIQ